MTKNIDIDELFEQCSNKISEPNPYLAQKIYQKHLENGRKSSKNKFFFKTFIPVSVFSLFVVLIVSTIVIINNQSLNKSNDMASFYGGDQASEDLFEPSGNQGGESASGASDMENTRLEAKSLYQDDKIKVSVYEDDTKSSHAYYVCNIKLDNNYQDIKIKINKPIVSYQVEEPIDNNTNFDEVNNTIIIKLDNKEKLELNIYMKANETNRSNYVIDFDLDGTIKTVIAD